VEGLSVDGVRCLELTELTVQGLALVAGQLGLSVKTALRLNALVGGTPARAFGARFDLLTHLQHTVEANGIFSMLLLATLQIGRSEGRAAVATWQSAAARARGALRPDGYVMVDDGQTGFGCFLEYDRGTESARDYRRKFRAYYRYRDTGRAARDYDGFPTILVITSAPGPEERIAKALRSVFVGHDPALPLLLTTVGWIKGQPEGVLGPIWRDPWSERRRCWPDVRGGPGSPTHQDLSGRISNPAQVERRHSDAS
jgi:hypothetical protein